MKRMKVPDYKEKSVFGVPLIIHVQRCGFPLPLCLQQALSHLRTHCLDQVGERFPFLLTFHLAPHSHTFAGRGKNKFSACRPLCLSSGGAVPQVGREVSHPGAEAAVRALAGLGGLRGPVGVRRGRHGEAVLPRSARASADQQAGRDLPAHLPV